MTQLSGTKAEHSQTTSAHGEEPPLGASLSGTLIKLGVPIS